MVWHSGFCEVPMEFPVCFDKEIFPTAVETERADVSGAPKGFPEGPIAGRQIQRRMVFLHQGCQLREIGHRTEPGHTRKHLWKTRAQSERREPTHAQPSDEYGRVGTNFWDDQTRNLRNVLYNPSLEVLSVMRKVKAPIAPETIAGHGQHQGWNRSTSRQAFVCLMGGPPKGPAPVASIDSMKQQNEGYVAAPFCHCGDVESQITASLEVRALESHQTQSCPFKGRI